MESQAALFTQYKDIQSKNKAAVSTMIYIGDFAGNNNSIYEDAYQVSFLKISEHYMCIYLLISFLDYSLLIKSHMHMSAVDTQTQVMIKSLILKQPRLDQHRH